jgi:sugar phosphate isomerase/epimerase
VFSKKEYQPGDWTSFATEYSQLAKPLSAAGISIGYHNHSHELARYDGQVALQTLIDTFAPEIWMEIDTYWVQHGGGDPAEWINKVHGRIPCVHFKDMAITPQREQRMAEVGEGNLNWPAILAACRAAGTQWYIVEQDATYGKDPFDCLATSLRNLKAMGLS